MWVTESLDVAGLLVLRGENCPDQKHEEHARGGDQEKWTTTNTVNEESARNGDDEREKSLTTVERDFLVLVFDTHRPVDYAHVVGNESVTRVLRDDTERDEEHKTVSVATGAEEIGVGTGLLSQEFETESLLDFLVLKLDSGVLNISVGMVLSESGKCFLGTVVGDVPSWRFWDPVNKSELDGSWKDLEESDGSP